MIKKVGKWEKEENKKIRIMGNKNEENNTK